MKDRQAPAATRRPSLPSKAARQAEEIDAHFTLSNRQPVFLSMSKVCPAARLDRACDAPSCSLVHTVYRCSVCRAPFASKDACIQHETSAAHYSVYTCRMCSVFSSSRVDYESHIRGQKHRAKLTAYEVPRLFHPIMIDVPAHHRPCDTCDTFVPEYNWAQHVKGQRHRSKTSQLNLIKALDKTKASKHGIRLSCDSVDFGIIDGSSTVVTALREVKVVNEGTATVVLANIQMSASPRSNLFQVLDASRRRQLNRTNSTTITICLFAAKKDRGTFNNRLEMHFEVPSERRRFSVTCPITAKVGSKSDYEDVKPADGNAHVRSRRPRQNKIGRYFGGVRPQLLAKITWVKKLEMYDIPADIDDVLSRDDLRPFEKLNILRSISPTGTLSPGIYCDLMQLNLWVEEDRARQELGHYDMQDVELTEEGSFYELTVPGLAEKRPSVLIGDRFFVTEANSTNSLPFEGFVHKVKRSAVLLRFNKNFRWSIGKTYDVRFDLNKLVFRRMHQAVTRETDATRILFPSPAKELKSVSISTVDAIVPYDTKITGNEAQHRAVASIVNMPPGSIPFIVFGPPGTGKTVTLVEAVRQIVSRSLTARVLVCAPSNSAADILVERLSTLGKKALFRLIAPSRSPGMVSSTALQFSRTNVYGVFECPPREELESFRVVVSTCCSGGVPYGIGIEPGHFTHIIVDEAAQATETEVMIPIKTVLGPKTNVVLAGDVKQIGPIIRSPIARELGFGQSFVERLMSQSLFDEARARGRSMVKLTKNYRSHPAILEFPNAQFYKNELEPCARKDITHCISGRWDGLIKKDYPIIFHGICGQDIQEETSPSYFNIDEAVLVKDYVNELLRAGLQLESKHIGVITPYRAQVLKIRKLLLGAPETSVGSVEEFQGQERKVIIISTVRSSPDLINFDMRHTLGFVANPRRLNVAVTRAQALLIVVGDPYVLALDPIWKEFINQTSLRGGYTGVALDWDPADPNDRMITSDEARRAQGLSELEDLIERTAAASIYDEDVFDEMGPIREED